jgi:signal transduction histidine kinase
MTAIVCVLGVSLLGFSILLHAAFRRALLREFDARLSQDAHAIAGMVEERASEPWEFEDVKLAEFDRKHGGAYFEVLMDDGTVLARSPSLANGDLKMPNKPPHAPLTARFVLPDGRHGRVYRAALAPRLDDDGPPKPSGRRVTVVVARATHEIDEMLATLRLLLWGSGLSALSLATLAGVFAIRRGLRPVASLIARADAINATRLGDRLPVEDLPEELRPAIDKLNELLARIEESFVRERHLNAAISHELRTPLAGLQTILEVCASRERTPEEYRKAIADASEVVKQMTDMVEHLLMLARLEAGNTSLNRADVRLRELVDECFQGYAERARMRRLTFENRVPAGAELSSDRDKLRIVITNLLSNAVEYTAEAGRVTVESDPDRGCVLDVTDSGPQIPTGALHTIFEPFVRLEPARSGSDEHAGIGLALTRALCEVLELSVSAENRTDGWVAFRLRHAPRSALEQGAVTGARS